MLHSNKLGDVRIRLKIFFLKIKYMCISQSVSTQVIEHMVNCKQVFRESKFVFARS